ncbi:MAG: GNVR domain-containing protein, partial [Rubrivivax sp.]|nr:GNVR domain-containing protein [Rubrivivax sp.]
RLSSYQKDKGIVATDERLDIENARLAELSSQLVMLQAVSSESGSRQAAAQGASGDRTQEVLNSGLVSGLTAEMLRSEAKLQEMSSRLGDNHPQVLEAKANIASLRSKVDAETARVTGGVGVSDTITRQREADVRRSLEAQRAKVLRLKAVRDEGIVLMRDVEIAQRAFETVVARFNQTSLESQNTQSNINVLTTASVPLEHSSPKLLLNTALAIFLGLLLAVGTALLLELMDRRVRSADDILAMLELPVLGVMPKPGAKGMLGGKQVSPMQQRLMAPLPPATKGA